MSVGLSKGGKAFFGGLCLGTFGLGCWQTRRYFEKVEEIEKREQEIEIGDPEALADNVTNDDLLVGKNNVRIGKKVFVEGSFRYADEILVGPRGAPKSAGLKKGRKAQGMATNPQGYYVVAPLERRDDKGVVLVKRGWVPESYVRKNIPWHRPSGTVHVTAVVDECEKRTKFSPTEHPFLNKLIWFDRKAVERGTNTSGKDPLLISQVTNNNDYDDSDDITKRFPLKASVDALKEFTITPEIHLSYAVTWFGLSAIGVLMTKKLMLRGR